MTLLELLTADILNIGAEFNIYTECEEIYKGGNPLLEVPAEYGNRRVINITPHELVFNIFVSRKEN